MNRKRRLIIEGNEVSELKTYSLGGYEQKVLIDGKSRSNPVLIFLHGGPGSPIPFCEGCRGLFPEYTDKMVIVYWDQLGCGINNCKIDDSFTADSFADMTVDLIKLVKGEFPDSPIYLLGMSWGSVLAAKAAERVPELIDGVIVYGQILSNLTFNDEVYGALEKSKMPSAARKKLSEIKALREKTVNDTFTVMKYIRKYTDGYICKSGKSPSVLPILLGILSSPDYRFRDFRAMVINGYTKDTAIMKSLHLLDLRDTFTRIEVPYLIMQGSTDIVTSTTMIREYISGLGRDNLSVMIIPDSGHIPNETAIDKIFEECSRLAEEKV